MLSIFSFSGTCKPYFPEWSWVQKKCMLLISHSTWACGFVVSPLYPDEIGYRKLKVKKTSRVSTDGFYWAKRLSSTKKSHFGNEKGNYLTLPGLPGQASEEVCTILSKRCQIWTSFFRMPRDARDNCEKIKTAVHLGLVFTLIFHLSLLLKRRNVSKLRGAAVGEKYVISGRERRKSWDLSRCNFLSIR